MRDVPVTTGELIFGERGGTGDRDAVDGSDKIRIITTATARSTSMIFNPPFAGLKR